MNHYSPVRARSLESIRQALKDANEGLDGAIRKVSIALTRLMAQDRPPGNESAVLDLEFGIGLNFWATLAFWHENSEKVPHGLRLDYFAISQQALDQTGLDLVLRRLGLDQRPGLRRFADTLQRNWPLTTPGLHCLEMANGTIRLWLWYGPLELGFKQVRAHFDVVYLPDGGALSLPERLQKWLLTKNYRTQQQDEFVYAWRPWEFEKRLQQASTPKTPARRVAVVGAGIAGASVARALCRRGAQVTLYDQADQAAQGASGNWVGAFHPHFTKDDSLTAQLTRLGCEFTVQTLRQLTEAGWLQQGRDWEIAGHYQTVEADQLDRTRAAMAALDFPAGFIALRDSMSQVINRPGLYMPQGAWVKPPAWVRACLSDCGPALELEFNQALTGLPTGFDAVVLAAAQHTVDLLPEVADFVNQVKGQITKVRRVDPLPCVLSGASYAIDPNDGSVILGATYERPVLDLEPSDLADIENLDRFKQLAPALQFGSVLDRRCAVRSVWRDRLPAVGAVPQRPGVFLCTGFASRGLTWAAMAAEALADEILGHGLEHALLDRIKPQRFLR